MGVAFLGAARGIFADLGLLGSVLCGPTNEWKWEHECRSGGGDRCRRGGSNKCRRSSGDRFRGGGGGSDKSRCRGSAPWREITSRQHYGVGLWPSDSSSLRRKINPNGPNLTPISIGKRLSGTTTQ
jgi:hypothetical protein